MRRDFSMTVTGSFAAAGKRTHALLSSVVRKAASDVEAQAKDRAPIITGTLKNSIKAEPTGELSAEVAVGAGYGAYVEFGTVKSAAKPYLGPAVEAVRPGFEAAVAAAIEKGAGS